MSAGPAAASGQAPRGSSEILGVAVVICAWSVERWPDTRRALQSVVEQVRRATEIVLVSDNNPELVSLCRQEFPQVTAVLSTGPRGASAARNAGVAATSSEIIAFLDDDAVASPHWLEKLIPHHLRAEVVGTGGYCAPGWDREEGAPSWFPDEFAWAVGASYPGMPTTAAPVRNVWSCSMTVRRDVYVEVGGFIEEYAKIGKRSRQEDTEFCIRSATRSGGQWVYEPEAAIEHRVPEERSTFSYFVRRCFNEGEGKAEMSAVLASRGAVAAESRFVRDALLRVAPAQLLRVFRGDPGGAARAGAIVSGVLAAMAGYLRGRLLAAARGFPPRSHRATPPGS